MMMNHQHTFSARAPGGMFQPPFMHNSNSQPNMFGPRPSFYPQPMPMMNGFAPFERPPLMSNVNGPTDAHSTGAIPRVQPIGPPGGSVTQPPARLQMPTGNGAVPPGFNQPQLTSTQPQNNTSGNLPPNNLPSGQSNESKLFAAIYGVRRNHEVKLTSWNFLFILVKIKPFFCFLAFVSRNRCCCCYCGAERCPICGSMFAAPRRCLR